MSKSATVLVPSLGNPVLIENIMDRLKLQDYKNFNVLLVMPKNSSHAAQIVDGYREFLNVQIIAQKKTGFLQAYNEGLENATGDIILFTDDDAMPEPNWVSQHVAVYESFGVAGVSGDVIPAYINDGVLKPTQQSEVLFNETEKGRLFWLYHIVNRVLQRPLRGLEEYYYYISTSGYAETNYDVDVAAVVNSLPCMGANMSVHRSSIGDFRFPLTIHKRGIECERILGWYLWKRGYRTVLCQDIKTYHLLQHGDTLSRCKSPKNVVQNSKERELLFYYLAIQKEKVSVVFHMSTLILNFLIRLRNRDHDLRTNLAVQKGMIMGNVTGLAMMISRKVGGKYNPSNE